MTVEQRLDQLEKRNKRLTVALTMTVVAMCAVVTMAATNVAVGDNRMRYEFHRDTSGKGMQKHHLLDNMTGDMWRIEGRDKKPIHLKK